MITIPPAYARQITAMLGDRGAAWLATLPATAAWCAAAWELTIGAPFANLSYNYVVHVTRADGTPAVLKLGLDGAEFGSERAALAHFAGRGAVRLLAATANDGEPGRAILLARVQPGTPLTTRWEEDAATTIAATVMRELWRPVADPAPFRTVADWGAGFGRLRARFAGGSGPIPAAWAARAEADFAALVASQAAPVLLHGDLHHDNILAAGGARSANEIGKSSAAAVGVTRVSGAAGWVAIDPKGVIGEPAYEVGAFLRNPGALFARPEARAITARRIAMLADALALDPARLRAWAFAQAILSAWWCIEDNAPCLDLALAQAGVFAEG